MDGPSSRIPSISISPGTNITPNLSFSHTPHHSLHALFSNVPGLPTGGIDPPRPAKQGYEWVWFPAGYWAEREIVVAPPKQSIRTFRWRKRSDKSTSGSPKRSSHNSNPFSDRMQAFSEHSASGRLLSRTAASSESAGPLFPLNRMADAPLPSPYLTEETHVQSLQWPSIDAAARRSSTSGSSMFKFPPGGSSSPLPHSHAGSEIESESVSPGTTRGNPLTAASSPSTNTSIELPMPTVTSHPGSPSKKSFIKWPMLSQNRSRLKRPKNPSDEKLGRDSTNVYSSRLHAVTASPLRKTSNMSDKSRSSLKILRTKLLKRAQWSRKRSNSSAVSVSSSLHTASAPTTPGTPGSERGDTVAPLNLNAWDSEYPGNEAVRVQTPSIKQFPNSFFQNLPPAPPHRPLSRQEGQGNLKKTNLSTCTKPGGYSDRPSTSSLNQHHYSDADGEKHKTTHRVAGHTHTHTSRQASKKPRKGKDRTETDWWEVKVPASYAEIDQRTPFNFDLPEHLPTSPMCPANKRHKSGGTGVCVYHGRAKSRGDINSSSMSTDGDLLGQGKYGPDDNGGSGKRDGFSDDEDESDLWK